MKTITAVFIIVDALLLAWYVQTRSAEPAPPEVNSTDQIVQRLASDAVKDAEKTGGVKLDYTPESIKSVEQVLGKLHEQYVKAPSSVSVNSLAAAYGAYIGEVIRRTKPNAHWERDHAMGQEVYLLSTDGGELFLMNWCWKRIENGEEDDVWDKYEAYKAGAFSSASKK